MTREQIELVKNTAAEFGCVFYENEPLSKYVTFGIGGKCRLMLEVNSAELLCRLVPLVKKENIPYFVIGRGSNLLIDDSDIDMVFLHMGNGIGNISEKNGIIECEAGAALSSVCVFARDRGLSGLEFAYGIPGNTGGAVYMNAGAYGGEIKDCIYRVEAVDSSGQIRRFTAEEADFGYRRSIFCKNGFIIVKAAFKLKQGNKAEIAAKMNELTARRKEKQPLEFRSAGSTFKRPDGAFAAALIEQCGLKGFSSGGAQVSEKHSGFVINRGGASFADVMAVIDHVKDVVRKQTGYELECEPVIISSEDHIT